MHECEIQVVRADGNVGDNLQVRSERQELLVHAQFRLVDDPDKIRREPKHVGSDHKISAGGAEDHPGQPIERTEHLRGHSVGDQDERQGGDGHGARDRREANILRTEAGGAILPALLL